MPESGNSITRRDLVGATGWWLVVPNPGDVARLNRMFSDDFDDTTGVRIGDADVPAYPKNPFIVTNFGHQFAGEGETQGWSNPTLDWADDVQTLLQFHQDVLDFALLSGFKLGNVQILRNHRQLLTIARLTGIPVTAGWNPSLLLDEHAAALHYGPIMNEQSWTFPDGSHLTHPHGILAKSFTGHLNVVVYLDKYAMPSAFAPGTLHLIKKQVSEKLSLGFSGYEQDGVDTFNLAGLDFSVWARQAFRDHLKTLPRERLREWDIADPSKFDIKAYLNRKGLTPESDRDPRTNPVFREYVLHHHRGIKEMFADIRAHIDDNFTERVESNKAQFWANQYTGSLQNPQLANVYASDHFDLIYTELFPSVAQPSDPAYKYMMAIGNYQKQVQAKGTINVRGSGAGDGDQSFNPDRRYPMLSRFQVGEAYGMGTRLKIPLTSRVHADETVNHWLKQNGSIEPELQSFIDFLWAHKRFLTEVTPDNNVAVVWSLPNRMWRRLPQWGIPPDAWNGPDVNSFLGATDLLREAQIPYDVLIFGHTDLWDDSVQLARLPEYEIIVLPNIMCVNDAQLSALGDFLNLGGTVISSGSHPDRSEMFEKRTDIEQVFEHENAIILENDPAQAKHVTGDLDGSLLQTLRDHSVDSLVRPPDPFLGINRLVQPETGRLVVHLLNYEYSPANDSFTTKTDISVRLSDDRAFETARYYSPERITDLELSQTADGLEFEIPELVEWGFVVLANGPEALQSPGSKDAATRLFTTAKTQVTRAKEATYDTKVPVAIANVRLREAKVGISYEAYEQAEAAANSAIDLIESVDLSTPSATESGEPTARNQTTKPETDRPDPTTTRGPGFGGLSALVSILFGISYVLRKRMEE